MPKPTQHPLLTVLRQSWGWTGLEPAEILGRNAFGNLLVADTQARVWRVCPEDGYCRIVAENMSDYAALRHDPEFQLDWNMEKLVQIGERDHGKLKQDQAYCLAIPGYLGGTYATGNIKTISLRELIDFSGNLALSTKDLPDGAQVDIKILRR